MAFINYLLPFVCWMASSLAPPLNQSVGAAKTWALTPPRLGFSRPLVFFFIEARPGSKIARPGHSSSSSMTCRSHLALGVLPGPQPQSSRWTRRLGCSTASALRPRPGYAAQPEVGSGRGGVPLQSTDFYRAWWTPARRCFSRSRRTGRLQQRHSQKPAALLSAGPGPSPSRTRLGRSCRVPSPRLLTSSTRCTCPPAARR